MSGLRSAGPLLAAAACVLAAAAWGLAQGGPAPNAPQGASAANQPPVLSKEPGRVSVRVGGRAALAVEALDPDVGADGAFEAVWLSAALAPAPGGALPSWLDGGAWSAGPSERPRLEIALEPPYGAPPGTHVIEAGATDARGLSAFATFSVTVLPPKCGPLEIEDGGVCLGCPEHRLPDGSRAFCEPCPAGTERPAGSPSCTDCPVGEASRGGAACAPRPTAPKAAAAPSGAKSATAKSSTVPDTTAPTIAAAHYAGSTVTLTLSEPAWAESPPAGNDFAVRSDVVYAVAAVGMASREAEADKAVTLTLGRAVTGSAEVLVSYVPSGAAKRQPRDAAGNRMRFHTVTAQPRRTLTVSFDGADESGSGIAEDAGEVGATVSLDNPPASGGYTGCGLRLAAGGAADAADVAFINGSQALNPGNGWRAADVKLLRVVDDALAEGDEALAVEAFCTGSAAGTSPAASGLASEPARVTLADNESRAITLAAKPAAFPETAGPTPVTVTATLDGQATEGLALDLTLSGTATADDYAVTGTRRIGIGAGATGGSTVLTFTPVEDADGADETVAIDAALAGYAVAGAVVTIAQPVPPPTVVASTAAAVLREDAGTVTFELTLANPPASGGYTGCGLRLAAGSEAQSPADVAFPNRKRLRAANGWRTQGKLLRVVDDAVAEDREALVLEGHCTGREPGTEPAVEELLSKPLRLAIKDDDRVRPLALSVDPGTIGETLGEQAVTVTATLDAAAPSPVAVDLSLGPGSYAVAGTQRITVPKGSASGSTTLAFTPRDDGNAADDAVAIGGTAAGHQVAGASLTIAEPTVVGGVDVSGLAVRLAVSPTAIREGTRGGHRLGARLDGVDVPAVDVSMVAAIGGTATRGASHDYKLTGASGWKRLTVRANDAHLEASSRVTVTALADSDDEGEETVTFTVSQVTWGTKAVQLRAPAVATLRITEAWETPRAPKGLAAAPSPGNAAHGLDARWDAVAATPPVEGYVVRHREVTAPPSAWTEAEPQPGTATAVTGLNAGTRHELRVYARNAAGDGPESGSAYAVTADGGCPMAAPSVATPAGARSSSSLDASWRAPACGAAVAGYRVRYREDPDVEGVGNGWTEIAASGTAATVTGLVPDTAYVVAVRAVTAGGDKGPWSPEGKGRTGLDARLPPRMGAPSVAPHSVDGGSRLEATWTRVAWTDGNGAVHPIAEYQHRHRPAGGAWTAAADARATAREAKSMTRSISGLAAGTWHEVQVRAVNRMDGTAHPGKWSEPGRGRTWGAPDRVEAPSAHLIGQAVEVAWKAPDDGGSPITDYDVGYRVEGSSNWRRHPYAGCVMGACAAEASINALARKVRVRAGNALGMGEWSRAAKVEPRKLLRASYGAAAATVREGESLLVTARLDSAADRAVSAPVTTTGDATAFRLDGLDGAGAAAFGLGAAEQTFTFVALQDADAVGEKVTLGFGTLPAGVRLEAPASLVVTISDDESGNGAPAFDAGAAAVRAVAENAAPGTAVGAPVAASDPEGDALAYSLSGVHAALFTVDRASGQIKVGADAELDFEGAVTSHAVTVEVGDGKDASGAADPAVDATIAVTVNVTDVAEPPSAPAAPVLTATATTLAAAWAEPDNTGPAITGYDLHHRASGEVDWTDAQLSGTAPAATIGGLPAGTAHEVRVRAGSDEGTSGWSASAEGNTLPAASLTADALKPEIADGNAAVAVTLSGRAEAAGGGTLQGAWLERGGGGAVTVLEEGITLTDGVKVTRAVSSSAPGPRTFGFRATHSLDGRAGESTAWTGIEWRPQAVLSATPASVPEDGGAAKVTVTATLTGSSVTKAAKTVTVSVAGGTATAGDDFTAVKDFAISIPGEARSADGSFTLTPVADSAREGPETVLVSGTASDGAPITVTGATVRIVDADPKLTVTAPSNGRVTGTTGSGDAQTTVIDCGSGSRTDCSASLPGGTLVTLSATADAGHLFDGWTGACSGAADCALTLNADSAVGARFVAARTLTVTAPAHGKVVGKVGTATVIDCGSDCAETVADGTKVALSASAADGHRFDAWGGACAAEASTDCSLTLDADRAVSVAFAAIAVDGQCDETAVDACAAGGLNAAAVGDTDSHHRWRCDGTGGGANSRTCVKAKDGCAAGSRDWSVLGNACTGSVTGVASGQTRAASDGGGPATGSASFKCDDGAWVEQAGSVCGLECAAATRSRCELAKTAHGGSSGTCGADSTGSCSHSCSNGVWTRESGQCNARCPTSAETWTVGDDSCSDTLAGGVHGDTRTASDNAGSARGSASYRCSDGDWLEQPGSTCERECRAATHDWRVGSAQCSARLDTLPSGWSDLAEDDAYRDTGTARYACKDGSWTGPSSQSCRLGCAAATIDDCVLANRVHNDSSGSCAIGSGTCSYTCVDGRWSENSNSCRADCDATTETWTVDGNSCEAPLAAASHGDDRTATDAAYPETGSATYTCDDGTFDGPTGETCHAGCGGATLAGCVLPDAIHDGEAGSCAKSPGACSYKCDNGTWKKKSNNCPVDCGADTATWTVGDNSCSASRAATSHGADRTVRDTTYSESDLATGSATYMCSYGAFGEPTGKSCNAWCRGVTRAGCVLSDEVHGEKSGACMDKYTGSCSYTCDDGGWDKDSNTCTPPKYKVKIDPKPTKGKVTGDGFNCPKSVCEKTYNGGEPAGPLTADPKAGYKFEWRLTGAVCKETQQPSTCSFNVNSDVKVDPQFSTTLKVDAGGEYTALYVYVPPPFGNSPPIYVAAVTATASMGKPPYTNYQWGGRPSGATAYYTYPVGTAFPATVTVTVMDANKESATDTASIVLPSASAAEGGSSESFRFEVPLGGELYFIWGGDEPVAARSSDASVVTVSTASPSFRVAGVGLGEAHVAVRAGDGEWQLPVVVR